MSIRETPSITGLTTAPRRDQIVITTCIAVAFVLSWAYLIHLQHQTAASDMRTMGMATDARWGITDVLFTFAMWAVMMVGMMTPAAAPLLLLFGATNARRAQGSAPAAVGS